MYYIFQQVHLSGLHTFLLPFRFACLPFCSFPIIFIPSQGSGISGRISSFFITEFYFIFPLLQIIFILKQNDSITYYSYFVHDVSLKTWKYINFIRMCFLKTFRFWLIYEFHRYWLQYLYFHVKYCNVEGQSIARQRHRKHAKTFNNGSYVSVNECFLLVTGQHSINEDAACGSRDYFSVWSSLCNNRTVFSVRGLQKNTFSSVWIQFEFSRVQGSAV
jgi:hypothetical protein